MSDSGSFLKDFLSANTIPQESLDYFAAIEWTNKYLKDPAYEAVSTFSRILKPTGEDYFFAKTLNTPVTIPHYITLRLRGLKPLSITEPSRNSSPGASDHRQVTVVPEKPDCIVLLSFGERGIDGHPNVVHGGVTCALLDETMGYMAMFHHETMMSEGQRDLLFTVNLNVNYRKPVPTPDNVIVKTWMVKRERKKWIARAQIVDLNNTVLAEAEALFVLIKSKL